MGSAFDERIRDQLIQQELKVRIRFSNTLPTLPSIALRVIQLAEDPDTSLDEIARCINLDPALSAKLLKVANSSFYARRRKSDNLRQAVSLLGLNGTVTLALGFSLITSVHDKKCATLERLDFWRRAILSAVAARALATELNVARVEDAFLGGLLQDIGFLAIACIMPEIYEAVSPESVDHDQLIDIERRMIETDHAAVGAWLLETWGLPGYLSELVASSHDPTNISPSSELVVMAKCIAVSGPLADYFRQSRDGRNEAAAAARKAAKQWLDISDDAFNAILGAIATALSDVSSLFEIKLLDPDELAGILEHAKEVVTIRNLKLLDEAMEARESARLHESRAALLEVQACFDSLTGLMNRRRLDEVIESEFTHSTSEGWPLSIAFVDLDNFKRINDTHGHYAGDQVLRSVAYTLTSNARETDHIARYGGEEFVLVLPGTGKSEALPVLERIMSAIRNQEPVIVEGSSIQVTASIGVSFHMDDGCKFSTVSDMLRAADHALFSAKREGRNQLVSYMCIGGE